MTDDALPLCWYPPIGVNCLMQASNQHGGNVGLYHEVSGPLLGAGESFLVPQAKILEPHHFLIPKAVSNTAVSAALIFRLYLRVVNSLG